MKKLKLFVLAAEKSGDMHAYDALSKLAEKCELELTGTGGPDLAKLGQKQFYDINDLSVIGVDEAIKKLRFLFKVRDKLIEEIKKDRPDAVMLVDYPGFNLRFAKEIKALGIPVIYFICPTFWVWNYKRIFKLRDYCDLVMCIYPFEQDELQKVGVNSVFVGNPLVKQIQFKCKDREEFLKKGNFEPDAKVIGLLPGSRRREVEALLPIMVTAAKSKPEYEYVLGMADTLDEEKVRKMIKGTNIRLATGLTHDIMKYSEILWICSGTATLEAALIGTPMILMYKTGVLTYHIAKMVAKTKYIGMPNIVLQKAAIPELIQGEAGAFNLVNFTEKVESDIDNVRIDLARVRDYFPDTDAGTNAAEEIYSFMENMFRENSAN